VSLNTWVFKWHLKMIMLSYSRMSAARKFQVHGTATEKAHWASSVCMRGTTSSGALDKRRVRGGAWVAQIRWSGYGLHLVSQQSHFISDPLPHRRPV